MKKQRAILSILLLLPISAPLVADQFELDKQSEQITVNLNGELFTRYIVKSGTKPILWPIIGPNGEELTRRFPMEEGVEGERNDHKHHRSFWFTHGDVRFADQNKGTSFWHEEAKSGSIVHREFLRTSGGEQAVIVTRNDWINDREEKTCVGCAHIRVRSR